MHALHLRPTSSAKKAVSHERAYDSYRKLHKTVYIILNMDIFLTKAHRFATGGLYSPSQCHVMHVLIWMRTLYSTTFGLFGQKHPPISLSGVQTRQGWKRWQTKLPTNYSKSSTKSAFWSSWPAPTTPLPSSSFEPCASVSVFFLKWVSGKVWLPELVKCQRR